MRIMSAIAVAIIMVLVNLRYCWLIITGETDPVFSSWLVIAVSVGLAFWTYCKTERHNLIDNIGNTIDIVLVSSIIGTISIFGQNVRAGFTWFEVGNLICAGMIVIFWWKSKNPFISNLAIQVLMVIGYFPMFVRLINASENPEPWSVWIPTWCACMLAMVPAYLPKTQKNCHTKSWKDTILPKVYATRAAVMVTILIILMLRLELK